MQAYRIVVGLGLVVAFLAWGASVVVPGLPWLGWVLGAFLVVGTVAARWRQDRRARQWLDWGRYLIGQERYAEAARWLDGAAGVSQSSWAPRARLESAVARYYAGDLESALGALAQLSAAELAWFDDVRRGAAALRTEIFAVRGDIERAGGHLMTAWSPLAALFVAMRAGDSAAFHAVLADRRWSWPVPRYDVMILLWAYVESRLTVDTRDTIASIEEVRLYYRQTPPPLVNVVLAAWPELRTFVLGG